VSTEIQRPDSRHYCSIVFHQQRSGPCVAKSVGVPNSTMKIINGWKNPNKQADKLQSKLRIGKVTVYDFFYDLGDRKGGLTFMNFSVKL